MSDHFWCRTSPRAVAPLLLLGALACVACESTDGAMLLRPAGGAGGGAPVEQTPGPGGASGTGGSAGGGGSSQATEPRDAGPDATPPQRSCVVGSLARYCALGDGYCPATYAEARTKLRELAVLIPRLILQQGCAAPDGSARIRVSAAYGSMSMSYIFEPSNEQLVSVQIFDDLGGCAGYGVGESSPGFGGLPGFYGEDLPGCSFDYANVQVPPECRVPEDWMHLDAGTPRHLLNDAGGDAGALENGAPYECIVAP